MTASDLFGIAVCAVCAALFASLVKKTNREHALSLTVAACAMIFLAVLNKLEPFVSQLQSMASSGVFQGDYLLTMLKAVGITLVGQAACQVCKDAGESTLAYTVSLAAKAAVLTVSLPMVTKLFEYLEEILKL